MSDLKYKAEALELRDQFFDFLSNRIRAVITDAFNDQDSLLSSPVDSEQMKEVILIALKDLPLHMHSSKCSIHTQCRSCTYSSCDCGRDKLLKFWGQP